MKLIFKKSNNDKLPKQIGDDFIDWAKNYLQSPEYRKKKNEMIKFMFDEFKSDNRERRRFVSLADFSKKLSMFFAWKGGNL
jgi:hypothetical protein